MFDVGREIFQTLKNNKIRTFLTGVSVAWGIFMLIILLGMSRGVYNSFNSGFMAQSSNTIRIWNGYTDKAFKGYKKGRYIEMKDGDSKRVEDFNNAKVESSMPVIRSQSVTISTQRDYITGSYQGVMPGFLKTQGWKITNGRFINEADIQEQRKVVVLSRRDITMLFPSAEEAIGKTVDIGDIAFTVIGVFYSEWGRDIYIPYSTARMLNNFKEGISSMVVEVKNVKDEKDGEDVEKDVRATLARSHEFAPDDESALWIWNKFTQHAKMSQGLDILNISIWIIGIFTMLSGIIGVSNIMFVSVKERTHEIGIRRAIGAKPRSILYQIILEGVVITSLFGYIGVVGGIGVTELLNMVFSESDFLKNPTVTLSIAFQVTMVLIVAGSLAGLFPALKALKVKPVEALRTE